MITRKSKHEYQVKVPINKPLANDDLQEMIHWCTQTFGQGGRNKKSRWRYGWLTRYADTFYFKTERDAMYFVLRWL